MKIVLLLLQTNLAFPFQGFESFDFGCLADQLIDGILPTSTRMSVANLPQSIGNATYLSVYNAILNKPILSLRIVDLTLKLNELILYFAFQVFCYMRNSRT